MRRSPLAVGSRLAFALALPFALFGCSDDSAQPVCENCENWDEIVRDLGRQASSHPVDPNFVVYGTIRKSPGAPDQDRESDEDLWLLWRGSPNPAQWVRWQITADEMGAGDNFQARWAPSGSKLAFVHSNAEGKYEVWSLDIVLPAGQPPDPAFDPSGTATLITANGRDPAWLDENRILFVRQDKIFVTDAVARGEANEVQVTFDPPVFVSSSTYVDRNPYVSSDGITIFSTVGREEVGDVLVGTFVVTPGSPPETTVTSALIGLQAPGSPRLVYPLTEGSDTLVTPANESNPYLVLHSLPSSEDDYIFGARRDSEFFVGEDSFCDTLLTKSVTLSSGEIDTVRFYFETARGTLLVASGRPFTTVRWKRVDERAESTEELMEQECSWTTFDCVLSYQVDFLGQIVPPLLEPIYVIGSTNTGAVDTVIVEVPPGSTTTAKVFCDADTCGCVPPPEPGSPIVASEWSGRIQPRSNGGGGVDIRALVGEFSIWRVDLSNLSRPTFAPIISSDFSLQTPILSPAFAGGIRYLAYVSNADGNWGLYVQKLNAAFQVDGSPVRVVTPGTTDNYVCDRNMFHPAWVAGSSPGNLRLLVTMTDCPDNGFEGSGFDDDPWSQGELNVWEVAIQ